MTQMIHFVPEAGLQPNGKELALALRSLGGSRSGVRLLLFIAYTHNHQSSSTVVSNLGRPLAYAQLTAFIQHTLPQGRRGVGAGSVLCEVGAGSVLCGVGTAGGAARGVKPRTEPRPLAF